MIPSLVPDFRLDTYLDVDESFIRQKNIRALLLDIDNTLEPYENAKPGEPLLAWFSMLAQHGVCVAFVSNNSAHRVELFNEELGYVAYSRAAKPFKRSLVRAMQEIGSLPDETVFVGDQVFTDVLAAHNAGIRAILLRPIRDRRDPLTYLKRLLERPILRAYDKRRNPK